MLENGHRPKGTQNEQRNHNGKSLLECWYIECKSLTLNEKVNVEQHSF